MHLIESYGKLPLNFEANRGQTHSGVKFISRGHGYGLFLTANEAVLALRKPSGQQRVGTEAPPPKAPAPTSAVLRMRLVGANPEPSMAGLDELAGKSNYIIGNDPKKWRTHVPNYAKVKYANVYPGVDLVYYGNPGQLEYDFVLAPGADPNSITMAFEGADSASVDDADDLVFNLDEGGQVRLHKPEVYQQVSGHRKEIDGRYVVTTRTDQVGSPSQPPIFDVSFQLASYDRTLPLVIDPTIAYSTYLGGYDNPWGPDSGSAIAVDSSGNAYIAGSTGSVDFPVLNAKQPTLADQMDVFITKLDPSGTVIVYSTFFGGTGWDGAEGLAINSSGNVYITGLTNSADFPTAGVGVDTLCGTDGACNAFDAFMAKLDATGSNLVYSAFLGGSGLDFSLSIVVDDSGDAYATGFTNSTDFPMANGIQTSAGGGGDAFVTKLGPSGSLLYSTYLGGSSSDTGRGIGLDTSRNIYVAGTTSSSDFQPLPGGFQTGFAGAMDGFVVKISADGSTAEYSTFLGGAMDEEVYGIAMDSSGGAMVTGVTYSTDFPTTDGAYDRTCGTDGTCNGDNGDAFVTKLNSSGSALAYSTYLGGSNLERGLAIASDSNGSAYVTGITASSDFPTTADAGQWYLAVPPDGFVTKLSPSGAAIISSTYYGGSGAENPHAIAVDASGNAYVTGETSSYDLPLNNAFQWNLHGTSDAFVLKLTGLAFGAPALNKTSLDFGPQLVGKPSAPQTITLSNTGDATLGVHGPYVYGDFAQTNNCGEGCATFPTGYIPFSSIQYTYVGPDAAGNYLIVGTMTQEAYATLQSSIPLPTSVDQKFCDYVQLAPGYYYAAFVPTAAERAGDFSSFAGLLLDPMSGDPFPGGIIPSNRIPGVFAWRIPGSGALIDLKPGASCIISVIFNPKSAGPKNSSLGLGYANVYPYWSEVSLTGVGVAPIVTTSPAAVSFGNVPVGSTSPAKPVTVINAPSASAPLEITSVSVTGPFEIVTSTCTGSIPIGNSCSISVIYHPTASGTKVGSILLATNAPDSPHGIALVGTGGAAAVLFCPASPVAANQGLASGGRFELAQAPDPDPLTRARVADAFGNLPLLFEAHGGQADSPARFTSHGRGYALALTPSEAILTLPNRKAGNGPQAANAEDLNPSRAGLIDGILREGPLALAELGLGLGTDTKPGATHSDSSATTILRMKLVGANGNPKVFGLGESPGRSNYLLGNDPAKWQVGIPNYSAVLYEKVYSGVNLVYYGNQRQIEYDFVVAPGADPKTIRFSVEGAGDIRARLALGIDSRGDLVIQSEAGDVRFHKPLIYQMATQTEQGTSRRLDVDGGFVLLAENQVGFQVGTYDPAKALVIDPVLSYSTYLGGLMGDVGLRIAVDSACNAYVAGITNSDDFPVTNGVVQGSLEVGQMCSVRFGGSKSFPCPDAFVTKVNANGTSLGYSTFLGGQGGEVITGIAVDSSGNAFLAGGTGSSDFPTTTGAYRRTPTNSEAFVAKLKPDGSGFLYSTFLGGSQDEAATGIAVDSLGSAYVTGATSSTDFPHSTGALQPALAVGAGDCSVQGLGSFTCPDAFVAKVNSTGSALTYSTYLGGNSIDIASGIAVDSGGNALVAGGTLSDNFPTQSAAQPATAGGMCGTGNSMYPCVDAFVSKLNSSGTALAYSTFLGGHGDDFAFGIATDSGGSAYVTGLTTSIDLPATDGAFQTALAPGPCGFGDKVIPCPDAFVTKHGSTGALSYLTYLGGTGYDIGFGIAVDARNSAYIVGTTGSNDFPTASPIQGSVVGVCQGRGYNQYFTIPCPEAFLTKLGPTGSEAVYSTYFGGASYDIAFGVAVDKVGSAYLTGGTASIGFPVTAGSFQTDFAGTVDGFVAKVSTAEVVLSSASVDFGSQAVDTTSTVRTLTLTNAGGVPLTISSVGITGDFHLALATTCVNNGSVAAGGNCILAITFVPLATGAATGKVTITDDALGSPHTIDLSGTGIAGPAASLDPTSWEFGDQNVGVASSAKTITLTNSGDATLGITKIEISGDFKETHTCTNSLAAGANCAISVTFTPTVGGNRTGTLTVTDNAGEGTQTAAVSGNGLDFSVTVPSGSPTSVEVSAGGTANYDLTLEPTGGFTGTATLTCSGAPRAASCSVSPTSVTSDGTTPAAFKVSVTTTARTSTGPRLYVGPPALNKHVGLPLVTWLLLLAVLAVYAALRRRVARKVLISEISLVAVLLVALFWVACGGGGGGGGGGGSGTPAGTYNLTVTATSGSVSKTLPLTLKVN